MQIAVVVGVETNPIKILGSLSQHKFGVGHIELRIESHRWVREVWIMSPQLSFTSVANDVKFCLVFTIDLLKSPEKPTRPANRTRNRQVIVRIDIDFANATMSS